MRTIFPVLLAACDSEAKFDSEAGSWTDAGATGDDDDAVPGTTGPPETEEALYLLPPAQTDVHVFVANPDRDTVTRIEVRTQSVDTTPVGTNPEIVLTT